MVDLSAVVILFRSSNVILYWSEESRALVMEPHGDIPDQEFREVHIQALRYSQEYNPQAIIIDETYLTHITSQSRIWLTTNFMRLSAVKATMEMIDHILIIRAQNPLAATLTGVMHKMISGILGVNIRYQPNMEKAMALLAIKWPLSS